MLIVGAIYKGLFASPRLAELQSWHTYSSDAVGVSIKYPPQWYPHEVKTPSGSSNIIFSAPVDNPDPQTTLRNQTLAFQLWRVDNTAGEALEDWAARQLLHPVMTAERHYMTVDNKTALQLEFNDMHSSVTAVNVGNYQYLIAANSFTDTYKSCADLFDEVISSIHFSPR